MDGGAWQAAVHGVAKSRTQLSDFNFTFAFMHWRRKWQPTPVFLPGKSQGQGSLVGCRLWDRRESDMTEATQQQQCFSNNLPFSLISPCLSFLPSCTYLLNVCHELDISIGIWKSLGKKNKDHTLIHFDFNLKEKKHLKIVEKNKDTLDEWAMQTSQQSKQKHFFLQSIQTLQKLLSDLYIIHLHNYMNKLCMCVYYSLKLKYIWSYLYRTSCICQGEEERLLPKMMISEMQKRQQHENET